MPCAPGPRNPGQFCSVLVLVFEASVTAGRAIKELARNERRDNSIDSPLFSSFISFMCPPLYKPVLTILHHRRIAEPVRPPSGAPVYRTREEKGPPQERHVIERV